MNDKGKNYKEKIKDINNNNINQTIFGVNNSELNKGIISQSRQSQDKSTDPNNISRAVNFSTMNNAMITGSKMTKYTNPNNIKSEVESHKKSTEYNKDISNKYGLYKNDYLFEDNQIGKSVKENENDVTNENNNDKDVNTYNIKGQFRQSISETTSDKGEDICKTTERMEKDKKKNKIDNKVPERNTKCPCCKKSCNIF